MNPFNITNIGSLIHFYQIIERRSQLPIIIVSTTHKIKGQKFENEISYSKRACLSIIDNN